MGLAMAVTLVGCAHGTPLAPSGQSSADSLSRDLQTQGLAVTRSGMAPPDAFPFFTVRAAHLVVSGEDVNAFEYATPALAAADAAKVSPPGAPIGTSQISWISPPRFYRKDLLIVLYVGTNNTVVHALETILGKPFAGAS
jgi:hypothetical protein